MEKELSFSILGVDDHATGDEIRAAYLTRRKTVHPEEDPDLNGLEALMNPHWLHWSSILTS